MGKLEENYKHACNKLSEAQKEIKRLKSIVNGFASSLLAAESDNASQDEQLATANAEIERLKWEHERDCAGQVQVIDEMNQKLITANVLLEKIRVELGNQIRYYDASLPLAVRRENVEPEAQILSSLKGLWEEIEQHMGNTNG